MTAPIPARGPRSWPFAAALALLLALVFTRFEPLHHGDVAEYSLVTIALAAHASPDIRASDLALARLQMPSQQYTHDQLAKSFDDPAHPVWPAFARGQDQNIYAIHFFGYPLLAAGPYKLLGMAGLNPFKCYLVVNLAALFVLGLALFRFFGSAHKASLGLALFLLCGGMLYLSWSSPECLSAAALLAGLLFYLSGAPLAGALLAGLAAQQNPTIVMFLAFAPLMQLIIGYEPEAGLRRNIQRVLGRRELLALLAGGALFVLPLLFNLWQFGVPNIIAKRFSDASLIGLVRLTSFYFDLNQGMLIGIPALALALLLSDWRDGHGRLLVAGLLFTLALALPALAVLNWNSGAAGVMRYAFWASMPLLFVLLQRLRSLRHWPRAMVAAVLLGQLGAMAHARSYGYVEFSPLAEAVMQHAPHWYHPEPEIFAERLNHNDDYIKPIYQYVRQVDGKTVTTLYHPAQPGVVEKLCGKGKQLAPGNKFTETDRGWRYIDGETRCW